MMRALLLLANKVLLEIYMRSILPAVIFYGDFLLQKWSASILENVPIQASFIFVLMVTIMFMRMRTDLLLRRMAAAVIMGRQLPSLKKVISCGNFLIMKILTAG